MQELWFDYRKLECKDNTQLFNMGKSGSVVLLRTEDVNKDLHRCRKKI